MPENFYTNDPEWTEKIRKEDGTYTNRPEMIDDKDWNKQEHIQALFEHFKTSLNPSDKKFGQVDSEVKRISEDWRDNPDRHAGVLNAKTMVDQINAERKQTARPELSEDERVRVYKDMNETPPRQAPELEGRTRYDDPSVRREFKSWVQQMENRHYSPEEIHKQWAEANPGKPHPRNELEYIYKSAGKQPPAESRTVTVGENPNM